MMEDKEAVVTRYRLNLDSGVLVKNGLVLIELIVSTPSIHRPPRIELNHKASNSPIPHTVAH